MPLITYINSTNNVISWTVECGLQPQWRFYTNTKIVTHLANELPFKEFVVCYAFDQTPNNWEWFRNIFASAYPFEIFSKKKVYRHGDCNRMKSLWKTDLERYFGVHKNIWNGINDKFLFIYSRMLKQFNIQRVTRIIIDSWFYSFMIWVICERIIRDGLKAV